MRRRSKISPPFIWLCSHTLHRYISARRHAVSRGSVPRAFGEQRSGRWVNAVLCVIAHEDEDEAIRIANDTSFGLHAFVSGTDIQRARRVASQILAGRVAINGMIDDQQAPFGGFKNTGVAREFGTFGIEAFLEPRAILEAA